MLKESGYGQKSKNGEIKWDLLNKYIEIKIFNQEKKRINFVNDINIKFINQIEHFFYCINNKIKPICKIQDGIMVLDIVNRASRLSNNFL